MSMPTTASRLLSAAATPTPANRPRIEATTPMMNASSICDVITCERDAPTARSSAISRLRWLTMIWNVL